VGRAQAGIRLADFDQRRASRAGAALAAVHLSQRHPGRSVWRRLRRRRLHHLWAARLCGQCAGCARDDGGGRAAHSGAARCRRHASAPYLWHDRHRARARSGAGRCHELDGMHCHVHGFDEALGFAQQLGNAPGIRKRN
jgi:hypothetical protein